MDLARAGAERIDMPDDRIRYPSFSDIEEQCAAEYDELLNALHDDELFAPADGKRQLLPALRRFYPARFTRFWEPFLGSGAVFFDLHARGLLRGRHATLSDD